MTTHVHVGLHGQDEYIERFFSLYEDLQLVSVEAGSSLERDFFTFAVDAAYFGVISAVQTLYSDPQDIQPRPFPPLPPAPRPNVTWQQYKSQQSKEKTKRERVEKDDDDESSDSDSEAVGRTRSLRLETWIDDQQKEVYNFKHSIAHDAIRSWTQPSNATPKEATHSHDSPVRTTQPRRQSVELVVEPYDTQSLASFQVEADASEPPTASRLTAKWYNGTPIIQCTINNCTVMRRLTDSFVHVEQILRLARPELTANEREDALNKHVLPKCGFKLMNLDDDNSLLKGWWVPLYCARWIAEEFEVETVLRPLLDPERPSTSLIDNSEASFLPSTVKPLVPKRRREEPKSNVDIPASLLDRVKWYGTIPIAEFPIYTPNSDPSNVITILRRLPDNFIHVEELIKLARPGLSQYQRRILIQEEILWYCPDAMLYDDPGESRSEGPGPLDGWWAPLEDARRIANRAVLDVDHLVCGALKLVPDEVKLDSLSNVTPPPRPGPSTRTPINYPTFHSHIVRELDPGPIGFVYLYPSTSSGSKGPDGSVGELTVGVILEERYRRQGHATHALETALEYAFNTIKCHRVQANVVDCYSKAEVMKLLTKMKFTHEGTSRLSFYSPILNEWKDITIMSILATDWALRDINPPAGNLRSAPMTVWDRLFARQLKERQELLKWDEQKQMELEFAGKSRRLGRMNSADTIRYLTALETETGIEANSEAASDYSGRPEGSNKKDKGKGKAPMPSSISVLPGQSQAILQSERDTETSSISDPEANDALDIGTFPILSSSSSVPSDSRWELVHPALSPEDGDEANSLSDWSTVSSSSSLSYTDIED